MDEEGDAGASTCSESEKVDSSLIKKILCQMKSEFNRSGGEGTAVHNGAPEASPPPEAEPPPARPEEKERIVLTLRKEEGAVRPRRRGPRKRQTDLALKRSSRRRMSKELTRESVLQSAIALKEKSFSSLNDDKPNRRSARLGDPPPASSQRPKSSRRSMGKLVRLTSDLDSSKPRVDDEPLDIDDDRPSFFEASFRPTKRLADKWSDTESVAKKSISHSSDSNSLDGQSTSKLGRVQENALTGLKRKLEIDNNFITEDRKFGSFLMAPEIAEGSESPSLNQLPPSITNGGSFCECGNDSKLYCSEKGGGRAGGIRYCRGLDTLEGRLIGCANIAPLDCPLVRPSKAVPHLLLCPVHLHRLIRHNACPLCGIFCTQGVFMECTEGHHWHKECRGPEESCCPHCGSPHVYPVRITLGAHKYPVFLPTPTTLTNKRSARMSLRKVEGEGVKEEGGEGEEEEEAGEPNVVLPSGKSISSRGIPLVEKDKLDALLQSSQNTDLNLLPRYTYRNMYQAAKTGDTEKMLHMLMLGLNPRQGMRDGSALHVAAVGGHLGVVHLLVCAGASTELLDKEQNSPLMLAARAHHNDVISYLTKAGASLTFKGGDGMTALHVAAREGNLEGCRLLLSSANTPSSYVDTVDDGRWTPLVWAAENCHNHVVRLLLEKGADPQIRDSEMNIALHWAAFAGSMNIAEDLLNYGSNINLSNAHGDTPLHIAGRQGAEECVVLLLSRGARVDMLNKAGHAPRECVLDKESYCYAAIDLHMKLTHIMATIPTLPRILSNDISKGYESNPIQCVNSVDEEGAPSDFVYIPENCLTTNISIDRRITNLTSCKCEEGCTGGGCLCGKVSVRCWYDNKGKLLPDFNFTDPPMIFECNPTCKCNALTCKNRVVQRGIRVRLQLYKTKSKNWAVQTLTHIHKGSYVCEYIGEIISDCEADTREDDSYLFDLDSRDGETYCIDARKYGNITRFINHSCSPNLLPVRVFIGHQDLHFPRIAFFANRDIPAGEELGFDYGEKFWIIKCKSFTCQCGAEECKYSEERIQETLHNYRMRTLNEENQHDNP